MAGLKDIKDRIRSVGATQKLTSAMKLIATARLRHALDAMFAIREYEESLLNAIRQAKFGLDQQTLANISEQLPWYFTKRKSKKPHAILVIGANKGLCGAYNLSIVREAVRFAQKHKNEQEARFIPLTTKASEYFLKNEPKRTGDSPGLGFHNNTNCSDIAAFALDQAVSWLLGNDWGAVSVVCGVYVNALVQKARSFTLFPFFSSSSDKAVMDAFASGSSDTSEQQYKHSPHDSQPKIEPSFITAITSLVHTVACVKMCRAFAESATGEHAARITTTDGAKKNAETLIKSLTLKYNRTRQARITSELIEIIAGTNAMTQE
ncbi:MAG: ATP synthase F1 subunit gamma [Holosporales bacterium]|jgi:F-type H+-transporting ATPase subunit gamma|nr:ATP synthase F1 subunit gamma [Holosporales bacterium]